MSRIAGIRAAWVARDLGGRVWNPRLRWGVKYAVFVEIADEDGRIGLGEGWCFDTAPDALVAYLRTEVAPPLMRLDEAGARQAMAAMLARATLTARHGILASALSAVDLALWDLAAQRAGLPLWRALGPEGPGDARVYASGGLYALDKGAEALAAELAGYAAEGYGAVKMKVGALDPAEDAARVMAARARLGPGVGLIVDGVSSYDAEGALRFCERIAGAGIAAFQAPVPPADLVGMRRLRAAGVPVMAGEAEYRDEVFAELIEGGAVSVLQIAPIACGGPGRVLDLAARCAAAGIGLSLEVSSTGAATLAALHLAAACPTVADIEIHRIHDVLFAEAGIGTPRDGRMAPPSAPGLGLALPPGRTTTGFALGAGFPAGGADKEADKEDDSQQHRRYP